MDPSFHSNLYHHGAQSMHGVNDINQLRPSDGQSMANYYNMYRSAFDGGDKLMYHHQQQQQQHHHHQQQQQHHHQQQQHHHIQQQQQHHHQQQQYLNESMHPPISHHHPPPQQQQQQQQQQHPPLPVININNNNIANVDPEPPPQHPLHPHNKRENPQSHHGVTYTCSEPACVKTFTHKNSLRAHLKTTHGIEKSRNNNHSDPSSPASLPHQQHQCPDCQKKYKSQGGLYWHVQTVHKKRVFNCTLCTPNKVYKSYPGFYLHRKQHETGGSYECQQCSKCFSQKATLKNHMKIHLRNGIEGNESPAAAAGREGGNDL